MTKPLCGVRASLEYTSLTVPLRGALNEKSIENWLAILFSNKIELRKLKRASHNMRSKMNPTGIGSNLTVLKI